MRPTGRGIHGGVTWRTSCQPLSRPVARSCARSPDGGAPVARHRVREHRAPKAAKSVGTRPPGELADLRERGTDVRLHAMSATVADVAVVRGGLSAVMVGRAAELRRLQAMAVGLVEPRVALISGEAGVRKSRLARELVATLGELPVLVGHAEPGELGRPFHVGPKRAAADVAGWTSVPPALASRAAALRVLLASGRASPRRRRPRRRAVRPCRRRGEHQRGGRTRPLHPRRATRRPGRRRPALGGRRKPAADQPPRDHRRPAAAQWSARSARRGPRMAARRHARPGRPPTDGRAVRATTAHRGAGRRVAWASSTRRRCRTASPANSPGARRVTRSSWRSWSPPRPAPRLTSCAACRCRSASARRCCGTSKVSTPISVASQTRRRCLDAGFRSTCSRSSPAPARTSSSTRMTRAGRPGPRRGGRARPVHLPARVDPRRRSRSGCSAGSAGGCTKRRTPRCSRWVATIGARSPITPRARTVGGAASRRRAEARTPPAHRVDLRGAAVGRAGHDGGRSRPRAVVSRHSRRVGLRLDRQRARLRDAADDASRSRRRRRGVESSVARGVASAMERATSPAAITSSSGCCDSRRCCPEDADLAAVYGHLAEVRMFGRPIGRGGRVGRSRDRAHQRRRSTTPRRPRCPQPWSTKALR